MKIALRFLEEEDEKSFRKALQAPWESHFTFAGYWHSLGQENFSRYIRMTKELSSGYSLPEGHVPCSLLFAFNSSGEIVGRSSIRHRLNHDLMKIGGHIGYGVVPGFRRQGYATEILSQSLLFVRENIKEIQKVLVTCDEDNQGSIRTIEKNGGILENVFKNTDMKIGKNRYWIDL